MINKFFPDVGIQLGYYVYRLIDPRNGQTFSVGKGQGNRVFAHVKDAKWHRSISEPDRWEFDAEEVKIPNDILIIDRYLHKRLPERYMKKGASNPIQYQS